MSDERTAGPAGAGRNRWLVLVIVCLGMFTVELDTTVVNIALPSIQRSLAFSSASLQLVVNVYLLFFGGFLLLGGRAGDLLGRKRLFVAGLLAFAAGSAINALAASSTMLVIGRSLQGLGGAAMTPTSLATINTAFTDPIERNRALGVWTAIEVGGVAIGLVLGGLIVGALSWRWIFILNILVAGLALVGTLRFVPESRAEGTGRGFDLAGAATVTGGLVLLTFTLTYAATWGWGSARTILLLAGAALLLGGFVAIEARSGHPLVRLGIFRIRSLTVGNVSFFLTTSGIFGMFFFSSLYVQEVLGFSPLASGLALLPLTVGIIVGASAGQPLLKRLDVRVVALAGLAIGVAGMLLLTRTSVHGPYASQLLPGIFVLAVGLGLATVPFTLLATSGVPASDAGLASGLYTAISSIGGAVGLAVLSTIAADWTEALLSSTAAGTNAAGGAAAYAGRMGALVGAGAGAAQRARLDALVAGYHAAYIAGAVLMAAAAALVFILLRRRDVSGLATPTSNQVQGA